MQLVYDLHAEQHQQVFIAAISIVLVDDFLFLFFSVALGFSSLHNTNSTQILCILYFPFYHVTQVIYD